VPVLSSDILLKL